MITYGIILLVVGLIGLAFDRALPQTRPFSTLVMYIGLGIGFLLLVIGIIVLALNGDAVHVNSMGIL